MYAKYFGLKEPSFSITPDPQYLFLSEQHQEALAHLIYGAGESGGFVLLTGEVGTGKTTICRAFLEQLPEQVELALILNPAMTATELLQSICDEFRIELSEDDRTIKQLLDRLNQFLLDAHARGKRPVLVIDEAQSLQPRVLEQIRLLTNLETPKQKLLQIFLVGQPELRTLLQQPNLRQVNQRITARYHLRPFHARDTAAYVRHRLAVAGVEHPLFTRSALKAVHRFSGGVPRLINILCDRALLGASVTRSPLVTRSIVAKAASEIRGHSGSSWAVRWESFRIWLKAGAAVVLVLIATLLWLRLVWQEMPEWREPLAKVLEPLDLVPMAANSKPSPPQIALAQSPQKTEKSPTISDDLFLDQETAMRLVLQHWGVALGELGAGETLCERIQRFGLACEQDQGGWSRLRDFDRPALLKLQDEVGNQGYAVLSALRAEYAVLDFPDGSQTLALKDLDPLWTGDYLLIWQPPPIGTQVIGPSASPQAVRWLRKLLAQVPGLGVKNQDSGRFDDQLASALRTFQQQAGLKVDGIAGPRTLIRLNNAVNMPGPPHLKAGG